MRAADRRARPVVIVIGALAPYTHVLYERLADDLERPLHILACSARETARQWVLERERRYGFEVLPGLRWHRDANTNHYANPAVVARVARLHPAVLVLNDFSPTMLMAAAAARLRGTAYGLRTDGVLETDPGRGSVARRFIRRSLATHASFGIGPSLGSKALLEAYGLKAPFALSPLFPAWRPSADLPALETRPYDVLFCGTLNEEVKGARFFTDVVLGCAERGRKLAVRIVGTGPLRDEMASRFHQAGVAAHFDGFLQHDALAQAYASSRLFLFPSRGDVWGIVVQEALQSGSPVIASPHSGVARELLDPHRCGLVLRLDRDAWVDATLTLLQDPARQADMRASASRALDAFTVERAAEAYRSTLAPFLQQPGSPVSYGPNRTSSV